MLAVSVLFVLGEKFMVWKMIRVAYLIWAVVLLGAIELKAAVVLLKGAAEVSSSGKENGKWRKVETGKKLRAGVVLRTGTNSIADFELEGGSFMRVTAGSVVGVKRVKSKKHGIEVELDLKRGRIVCLAEVSVPDSRFEVMTFAGACGARGATEFDADHDGVYRCVSGTVVSIYVSLNHDGPRTINGNEMAFWSRTAGGSVTARISNEAITKLSKEIEDLKASAKGKSGKPERSG